MNSVIENINLLADKFISFTWPMLLQSSILILILLATELLLRNKVRAVFRYWLWILVLLKLILPVSLSSPASLGSIAGDKLASVNLPAVSPRIFVAQDSVKGQAPSTPTRPAPPISPPQTTSPDSSPGIVKELLPPAPITSAQPLTWQAVMFVIWLAVVVAMLLLLLQRVFFVRGLIRQSKAANGLMLDTLEFCRQKIGLRAKVGLKVSPNATSPAVCGLFRPVILVPQSIGPSLGVSHLRAVFMHELAHIKRGDLWINLAQTLLQIVYFYNPLLWIANALIRRIREQAVDETVQVAMGPKAPDYPETLFNVAKLTFGRPALSLRLIGVVESKNALKARIKKMLEQPIPKTAKLGIAGLTIILVTAAILLPMAKAEKHKATESSEFKATLPNGVTVELVGVCEHPCEGKQWWRPDGKLIDLPYEVGGKIIEPTEGYQRLDLIARIAADEKNPAVKFITPGATRSGIGRNVVVNQMNVVDLWSYRFEMDSILNTADVKTGVASGGWKTISSIISSFKRPQKSDTDLGQVEWIKVVEENDEIIIYASNNFSDKAQFQIIAEDVIGRAYPAYASDCKGNAGLMSCEYKFHLSPQKAEEFKFQIRPYRWAIFKNVSLKAGQKTNVQIEVEQTTQDRAKELVEDFFKHNYRDITARKTIEWGQPTEDENGNLSIRYKYEATIWGKDKIIQNKVWTFDKQGKFVSVRKAGAEDIYSLAGVQALVEDFFANNFRDVTKRKTIEWGQPVKHQNGNVSIRYMYEALIWDKNKILENKTFTFDKDGKFVSVENVEGYPKKLDNASLNIETNDGFKPTAEEILPVAQGRRARLLDIDTGSRDTKSDFGENDRETHKWIRERGLDLLAFTEKGQFGLFAFDMAVLPVKGSDWQRLTAKQIRENKLLDQTEANKITPVLPIEAPDTPATYLFRTRENGIGILQITGYTENPESVKIRYKMAQKPAGPLETGPAENDLDVAVEDFQIRPYLAGGLYTVSVAIRNKGTAAVPAFRLNFYKGDPAWNLNLHGKPETGSHGAGPIEPDDLWNEGSMPFELAEGLNEMTVVLDTKNAIVETDETNNTASLKILAKDGQIIEKSVHIGGGSILLKPNVAGGDLQSMIDAVNRGGTVIVPAGQYTNPIKIEKHLILKGESHAASVFEVTANEPAIFVDTKGKGKVVIEGLIIKWQLATSDKNIEYPFALAIKDTKAEVRNCDFLPLGNFNRSPFALRVLGFSKVKVDSCRFDGFGFPVFFNEGTEGAVQNSIIADCQSQGITIFSGATVNIAGNIITGSKKHAVRNTGGTLRMKDNLVTDNANRGVYLGNKSAKGDITNNIIMRNGTGISGFARSKVKIENNLVLNNDFAGIDMRDSCNFLIRNNILQGNTRGLALFEETGKNSNKVGSNTFWQNKTDTENLEKPANSICDDPHFVDFEGGNFALNPGPAKDNNQGLTDPAIFLKLWQQYKQLKKRGQEPF